MEDISKIPVDELLKDLSEGIQDEKVCQLALDMNIVHDRHGTSTAWRLDENKRINSIIRKELDQRGISHE